MLGSTKKSCLVRRFLRHGIHVMVAFLLWPTLQGIAGAGGAYAQEEAAEPYISPPVTPHTTTAPVVSPESLSVAEPGPVGPAVVLPEGDPPIGPPPPRVPVPDPAIQLETEDVSALEVAPLGLLSGPDVNVAGMTANPAPPDTVLDVGPNHIVQMVNATFFQVFNKDGTAATGPISLATLWPAGDVCATDFTDPIVVYDHLADRWLLSQIVTPNHVCIAISQTPDPTAGTWFAYTFNTGNFPDYQKFGVWPDGYYMSSFECDNNTSPCTGNRVLGVYAFDRTNMLLGNAASFMKTTIPALGGGAVRRTRILPSDLDGPAPPDGTPNFFVRPVDDQQDTPMTDRIEVHEFAVDWVTPSFSFTLVDTLTPAPFQIMLCNRNGGGTRDCIPQPNTPNANDTLDALSNRPMMQLKYRRVGSRARMVFNQTIDVSGSVPNSLNITPANEVAGIRWYELDKVGANWTIRQQGTYAPQPMDADAEDELLHRWMGSVAIDRFGNIALGYSIVNADDNNAVFPGIRYTGRRFNDVLGRMPQGERVILNGVNPQVGSLFRSGARRWGDYSAMTVDPVDDCTFWYTTHVAGPPDLTRQTFGGPRPTQIGSFRFDNCSTDLRITKTANPDPDVFAGEELFYQITVTNFGPLAATNVTVVDTLPAGATYIADTDACVQGPVGTLTCDLGDIGLGGTATFTIKVKVSPDIVATRITNTAMVESDQADRNEADNVASVTTIVQKQADMTVAKQCHKIKPRPHWNRVKCIITVRNLGPSAASNVTINDTAKLGKRIKWAKVAPSQGMCGMPVGRNVTCNLGEIGPGGSATVETVIKVKCKQIKNIVTVTSDADDPNLANNNAEAFQRFKHCR